MIAANAGMDVHKGRIHPVDSMTCCAGAVYGLFSQVIRAAVTVRAAGDDEYVHIFVSPLSPLRGNFFLYPLYPRFAGLSFAYPLYPRFAGLFCISL